LADITSGKCFLLPGDNIIPNNLTMPWGMEGGKKGMSYTIQS